MERMILNEHQRAILKEAIQASIEASEMEIRDSAEIRNPRMRAHVEKLIKERISKMHAGLSVLNS